MIKENWKYNKMMNSSLEDTKFILKKYNITANKKLGQNFLINDEVIENIVETADIDDEDLVIEIGPGLGTLTSKLLERAGRVIAIELDEKMITILNDRFRLYSNFILLNTDILKVDLRTLIAGNIGSLKRVKIVANLPYYITTPIIMKLLEEKLEIYSITVMVQKEVADRITCVPGDKLSGAITYSVNYYAEAKKIIFVDKNSFIPPPEVDSEVIELIIRKKPIVELDNEEMFFKVIKASFMQRRKTLVNGLINSGVIKDKIKLKEIFDNIGIDMNIRGEKLTIEQFAELSNLIYRDI